MCKKYELLVHDGCEQELSRLKRKQKHLYAQVVAELKRLEERLNSDDPPKPHREEKLKGDLDGFWEVRWTRKSQNLRIYYFVFEYWICVLFIDEHKQSNEIENKIKEQLHIRKAGIIQKL